ncbi:EamA family transporter [Marinomonas mediterranea]|uniref:EamA family transporter n=1 Tax=Marinomonas mediterranea TaxID=119864 RepID=UPI00300E69E1|nr:EamA family transporter [Marinomonas mediterranea]WCN15392.1 EamA family transporter [Marinomonas mediterranea]
MACFFRINLNTIPRDNTCFYKALKLPTSLIAILSFIYPITALIVDHLAFRTHISLIQIAGVVLILLGVCTVTALKPKKALYDRPF